MIKCLTPPDVLLVEVGMEQWHFQEQQCSHKSSDRGEDDVNWEGDGELRRVRRLLYLKSRAVQARVSRYTRLLMHVVSLCVASAVSG